MTPSACHLIKDTAPGGADKDDLYLRAMALIEEMNKQSNEKYSLILGRDCHAHARGWFNGYKNEK